MSRRCVAATIVFVATAMLAAGCARPPHSTTHARVYVYLIDTLRRDHLGCYGYERNTSPNLDSLAADGVIFTQVTSSSPWTRPSVAGIFTGLPAVLHGVRGRGGFLQGTVKTWAEALRALGYETHGLVANANVDTVYGFGQGFDTYRLITKQGGGAASCEELHQQWLRLPVAPQGPVFEYLHVIDPHAPHRPPRRYRMAFAGLRVVPTIDGVRMPVSPTPIEKRQVIDLYDGEILQTDHALGELIAELKRRGHYDDSWIIVTADHGEEFWEHGLVGHGHGVWENLLRVPLVVKPPGGATGRLAARLRPLREVPLPLHALPDLLGPLLDAHWSSLAQQNGRLLSIDSTAVQRWVADPWSTVSARGATVQRGASPARARVASTCIDQRSEIMVERGGLKLVWRDQSREGPPLRYLCFDLDTDPGELDDLWPARAPAAARELKDDLDQLASDMAWGVEVRYDGATEGRPLILRTKGTFREAAVPPGGNPPHFEFFYQRNELEWTPSPGERIVVRADSGVPIEVASGGSTLGDLWPVPMPGLAEKLNLRVRAVGPTRFKATEASDSTPQPSAEVLEGLRALGYIK